MRRVSAQELPFRKASMTSGRLPCSQVAHAAVNKLGAAAGRALAEIAAFEQQDIVVARSGVDCNADASSATADDYDIPWRGSGAGAAKHFSTVHASFLPCTSTQLFSQSAMRAQI